MRLRALSTVIAIIACASAFAGERCTAIDGNTLRCAGERIRIDDISAPALDEPGGQAARQRLQRRIQSGEVVIQRGGKDKWGRTHARVYVNGNRITQVDVGPKSAGRR